MTELEWTQHISISDASRKSREQLTRLAIQHLDLFDGLMRFALDGSRKNHHKACWIAELVLEHDVTRIAPHLKRLCEMLPHFTDESALRSLSKICWFIAKQQSENKFLGQGQSKIIMDCCFDWLIGSVKVATKVYAMRALFEFGKDSQWVHDELQVLLDHGYGEHSAAYRAASRDVLKKILKLQR